MIKPLFIFSLPRSGSTLLQRLLSTQDDIASVSEPWILLPFIYAFKNKGVYAEYGHEWLSLAMNDFFNELPNGKDKYMAELRSFVLKLYSSASKKNCTYFLDKTPRYHLIIEEIFDLFPDAKFIFLWRNPLSIAASAINTWGRPGSWNLHASKVDLYEGLLNLVNAYEKNKMIVCSVNYEILISNPEKECKRICDYLEIPFNEQSLDGFSTINLKGQLGDAVGISKYRELNKDPINKWKLIMNNPLRKIWCVRYLEWIGSHRLKIMGYDHKQLIKDVKNSKITMKWMLSDVVKFTYGFMYSWFEPIILYNKLKMIPKWWKIHGHR